MAKLDGNFLFKKDDEVEIVYIMMRLLGFYVDTWNG